MSDDKLPERAIDKLHRETGIPIWALDVAFELLELGMLDEETMAGERVVSDAARVIATHACADLAGGVPSLAPEDMTNAELDAAMDFHRAQASRYSNERAKIWRFRLHMGHPEPIDHEMLAALQGRRAATAAPASEAGSHRCPHFMPKGEDSGGAYNAAIIIDVTNELVDSEDRARMAAKPTSWYSLLIKRLVQRIANLRVMLSAATATSAPSDAAVAAARETVGPFGGDFECPWCLVHPHRDPCTFKCQQARADKQKHEARIAEVAVIITRHFPTAPATDLTKFYNELASRAYASDEDAAGERGYSVRMSDVDAAFKAATPAASSAGAGEQEACPDCVEGKITAGCAIDKPLISVDCSRCKGTGRVSAPSGGPEERG